MDTTTNRRRIAYWTAGLLAVLAAAFLFSPLLFRAPIEARLKAQVGSGLNAHVDWSRLGLGLIRDFPNLTLRVDDLLVTGVDRFAGDTLLVVPRSRVVLDLGSVVSSMRRGGAVVVRSFDLREPAVHLVVLEDGTASWDIVRPDPAAPSNGQGRSFDITLRSFSVRDGGIRMENHRTGVNATVAGLGLSLQGDFARDRFTLASRTAADAVSLTFAGVPYLSGARLDLRADLDVDSRARRLVVRDNSVRLNDLRLELAGAVEMHDDSVGLDLAFRAPGSEFGEILSMVPAVYARDFETLQTAGSMTVSGWVRGGYGAGAFPALALDAKVENGSFRYPDLALPARDVFLDLSVANPGGDLDRTVLDVRRFRVVLGDDPVEGTLVVRSPVSDPDVDLRFGGRVNLADVSRTIKLDGVEELAGWVVADAAVRARMSDLDARRYERVGAAGTIAITDMKLRALELPHPLLIDEARLELSPSHADLSAFRGRAGRSDIAMTGRLDNLLGFLLLDEELRGQARVTSTFIDLDGWRSEDESRAVALPANLDFALDAAVDRIAFGELDMRNARGSLRLRDQRLDLDEFRMDMLDGGLTLTGFYETADPARPTFDMDLRLADVDVPSAFASSATVRAFAPVARYAAGRVTAELKLAGALGPDLAPMHDALGGLGSFSTERVRLQDFPPLDRLADALDLVQLRDPGFVDVRSTFVIRDGRLHVSPFDVRLGELVMNVAGSNGLDHSLEYTLGLQLPSARLGTGAERVVASLISQTDRVGLELQPSDVVSLGVQLTGTVTSPSVRADFRGLTSSAAHGVEHALRQEAERRIEAMEQRFDDAADAARERAAAEAARLVAEAERRAETMRAEARSLADVVRLEGSERADALLAGATTPAARLAARPAADRLRREADDQAARIVREADARAEALVEEARRRTGAD
jgi:hypothetical protein